jgi:hypothetical protein
MHQTSETKTSPLFDIGDKVRVKPGVQHPEFADIPLGGWSGTIEDVEPSDDETIYQIGWDRRTLAAMHSVFLKRCQRDDLIVETSWLDDDAIEPDDGTPIPIEQPTKIITPPLSEMNQDDRIRKAFGLTHDDPLPEVSDEALLVYHRYLHGKLKFPFTALYGGEEQIGPFSRKRTTMTVMKLVDPEDEALTEEDGLRLTARYRDREIVASLSGIEVRRKDRNYKLVDDYGYWFHNWPCRSDRCDMGESPGRAVQTLVAGPSDRATRAIIFCFGSVAGILGAAIGAAFLTFRAAPLVATIGGILVAPIGAFILGRYAFILGSVNRAKHGGLVGTIFGSVVGAILGVFAGLMIPAFPWSLIGIIAGLIMARFLVPGTVWRLLMGTIMMPACGILFAAYRQDGDRALLGAFAGSILGLIGVAGLVTGFIAAMRAVMSTARLDGILGKEAVDKFAQDDRAWPATDDPKLAVQREVGQDRKKPVRGVEEKI